MQFLESLGTFKLYEIEEAVWKDKDKLITIATVNLHKLI